MFIAVLLQKNKQIFITNHAVERFLTRLNYLEIKHEEEIKKILTEVLKKGKIIKNRSNGIQDIVYNNIYRAYKILVGRGG